MLIIIIIHFEKGLETKDFLSQECLMQTYTPNTKREQTGGVGGESWRKTSSLSHTIWVSHYLGVLVLMAMASQNSGPGRHNNLL